MTCGGRGDYGVISRLRARNQLNKTDIGKKEAFKIMIRSPAATDPKINIGDQAIVQGRTIRADNTDSMAKLE
ncbi:unnamed protein product, partial [Brenthis ino]